eukprot:s2949_g3.t1
MAWTPTAWWVSTTIVLVGVVSFLVNKVNKLNVQLAKHKEVWDTIKTTMNLRDHQAPFVQEFLPDVRREPVSGVWYEREDSEEECHEDDGLVNSDHGGEAVDREAEPDPPRVFVQNGTHGAADGDGGDERSERGEAPSGEHGEGAHSLTDVPNTAEGIEIMTEALAEIMDGAGEHGHVLANVESKDHDWIHERYGSLENPYRRYVQSGQEEVPDPDEWADIHYCPGSSARSRTRSRHGTPASSSAPVPRAMPNMLADQRDRRLADERTKKAKRKMEVKEMNQLTLKTEGQYQMMMVVEMDEIRAVELYRAQGLPAGMMTPERILRERGMIRHQ